MPRLQPKLAAVRSANRQRVAAERAFKLAVFEANQPPYSHSLRDIGEACGLSHVRVLQIVRQVGEGGG